MKKDHQENELWTAVNPVTGKREVPDPKSDFNPGETIVKLFLLRAIRWLCDHPWNISFQLRDGSKLETCA